MANRKVDACDNAKDLDRRTKRIDENDPNCVYVATVDDAGNELLQQIVDNIGGGTGGNTSCASYIAGETLSAVKLVYISASNTVSLADNGTKPEACVVGITRHSANGTEQVEVLLDGEIYDSSFNFTFGETLYLDTNGNLTNVPPTVGVLTVIGKALGNNKVLIRIEEPIIL